MGNKPDIQFTGNTLHVIPKNDSGEHLTEGNQCPCQPKVEIIGIQTIIVHNSFDERDMIEGFKKILNRQTPKAIDSFEELKN